MKAINFLKSSAAICGVVFAADVYSAVKVASVLNNDDTFCVSSHAAVVGYFYVRVRNNGEVIREDNGTLSFSVELKLKNADKNKPFLLSEERIICSSEAGEECAVGIFAEDNGYSTEAVRVSVREDFYSSKRNEQFEIILNFRQPGSSLNFEEVRLSIVPKADISLDRNVIDFGTLLYDGGGIRGNAQEAELKCIILNDGRCTISSDNGFYLKQRNGAGRIKYNVECEEQQKSIDDKTKVLSLLRKKTTYRIKFTIDRNSRGIPPAGSYEDCPVIAVMPNE
ncbi:MAG: hypothetical protein LBO73_02895 [Holosporaceae bacterium]|jgi:hypothetical protein|nr:hypothetical protein [Holosporaceae bacterium]